MIFGVFWEPVVEMHVTYYETFIKHFKCMNPTT